ncbi:hypothetical protein AAC387_Pa11g1450 [Persea americana]
MKCRLRKQCSRLSFFKPTFLTWKSCWTVAASQRQARERESETERGAARQSTGEGDAPSSSEIRRGERDARSSSSSAAFGERNARNSSEIRRGERDVCSSSEIRRLGREMRAVAAGQRLGRGRCAQQQRDQARRERNARGSARGEESSVAVRQGGEIRRREREREMSAAAAGRLGGEIKRERGSTVAGQRERGEQ